MLQREGKCWSLWSGLRSWQIKLWFCHMHETMYQWISLIFIRKLKVQTYWFASIITYLQCLDFYQFYHFCTTSSPQNLGTQTQNGKQEKTGTNLAMNNVCLCLSSPFEGKKGEMVRKGISLTLAGISVKEEELYRTFKERNFLPLS